MRRWWAASLAVFFSLVCSSAAASAQVGCLAAECHGDLGKSRHTHGPVAAGECELCHVPTENAHPGAAPGFSLAASENALCSLCHSQKTVGRGDTLHPIVEQGCTSCHDPHGGPFKGMLSAQGSALCYQCHDNKAEGQSVHPPVAGGNCTMCHKPHAGYGGALLIAPPAELCGRCHADKTAGKSHLHGPVADGDCTACHDAHANSGPHLLPEAEPALCSRCHESKQTAAVQHGPVAAGECSMCHDPHGSQAPYQLVGEGNELCYLCHGEKSDLRAMDEVHPVVGEGCTNCHDPHGDAQPFMLSLQGDALCLDCHSAIGQKVEQATSKHAAVTDGGCSACHDAHGTGNPKMFFDPAEKICFSCHEQMEAVALESLSHHGPVEAGECWICHDPHGSKDAPLLNTYYPQEFYTSFELENYDLCFLCHKKEAFTYERTATETGFRNGDQNLHYLHVNRPAKSRVCKACHGVHGADQAKLIKSKIPGFGAWEIPIRFTTYKTGATCNVGCHKPKTYDRVRPVRY